MKSIAITLVALCALVCAACDPGGVTNGESLHRGKDHYHRVYSLDSATVQNTGTLHNQALAAVRATYNFNQIFMSTEAQATYILSRFCGYFYQEDGWDSASYNTPAYRSGLIAMLDRRHPASDADAWDSLKADATFTSNVPVAEVSLIDDAITVFALPTTGMTSAQIAGRIIDRADSLLTIWGSTSWGPSEGEASGGFLHIMKASASYWRDNPVSTTENPNDLPPLYTLAQVDAAGYLYGWSMAVAEEIDANGSLSTANEGKRIRAGLRTAGAWSMGGAVRNFFGR